MNDKQYRIYYRNKKDPYKQVHANTVTFDSTCLEESIKHMEQYNRIIIEYAEDMDGVGVYRKTTTEKDKLKQIKDFPEKILERVSVEEYKEIVAFALKKVKTEVIPHLQDNDGHTPLYYLCELARELLAGSCKELFR